MKTKLNNWDAFKSYMEQIFYEGILENLEQHEITFYWNEYINALS